MTEEKRSVQSASPEPREPVAWLNPETHAVMHHELKRATEPVYPEKMAGFTVPLYAGIPQGVEADTARLEWLLRHLSGKELRQIGVEVSAGGLEAGRIAIDAAISQGGQKP
jgi:hypothetical protein